MRPGEGGVAWSRVPAREPDVVEFHEQRRSPVVDRMVDLAEAGPAGST